MKSENPHVMGHEFRLTWNEIIMSLACICVGLLLLIAPQVAEAIITTVIGAVGIVIGIAHVIRYTAMDTRAAIDSDALMKGMVWIAGGILFIAMGPTFFALLPVLLGFFILFCGVSKVQYAMNLRHMNSKAWKAELIAAFVFIAMGILVIVNPFSVFYTLLRIVGAVLVVQGIFDFIAQYMYVGTYTRYVETGFADKPKKTDAAVADAPKDEEPTETTFVDDAKDADDAK